MSEEFRDELAKQCKIKRPRFISWGKDLAYVTGPGVSRTAQLKYTGAGIFNVMGAAGGGNRNNSGFGRLVAGPQSLIFQILAKDLTPLLTFSNGGQAININSMYDNLDYGVFLATNDFLVLSWTVTANFPVKPIGFLFGDEYLF